jgi:hypothetical protein
MVLMASLNCRLGVQVVFELRRPVHHDLTTYGVASRQKGIASSAADAAGAKFGSARQEKGRGTLGACRKREAAVHAQEIARLYPTTNPCSTPIDRWGRKQRWDGKGRGRKQHLILAMSCSVQPLPPPSAVPHPQRPSICVVIRSSNLRPIDLHR